MKKILKLSMLTMLLSLTSCFESDTENAVEDIGEGIERAADDVKDAGEDMAEDIEQTPHN